MSKIEPSFFKKEVRCDFLVDEKRKKVWAVELELLGKFDEVCRKYGLNYYVYYGTLLGAVRHQGFIPWDDDIDVVMFREDYERFQAIAPWEFAEPYFFQNSYTDNMIWPFSKIRDGRTTGIEFKDMRCFHQGIFMDVFPLDDVPEGDNDSFSAVQEMEKFLWGAVAAPQEAALCLKQDLIEGKKTASDVQILLEVIKKEDIRERFQVFEQFCREHSGETGEVNYIMEEIRPSHYKSVKREWFRDTVYLPFEHISVPAPGEYDKILVRSYGDYRQHVTGGSAHGNIILEPDVPYEEYFDKYL